MKLPIPRVPVQERLTPDPSQRPGDYAERLMSSFASHGSPELSRIITRIAKATRSINAMKRRGEIRVALVIADEKSPSPTQLVLEPPYRGSVQGVPSDAARVLRTANGITLENCSPTVRWFPYLGSSKGFDFEWDLWDVRDNFDGLWKAKPVAPFTDGQDLWVYHPAVITEAGPELIRLEHERGDLETERVQDASLRFFQLVAKRLEL